MNRPGLLACAMMLGFIAPAQADTVTLKNGREIHGKMTKESKDSIEIRTSGGRIVISKGEIATFNENADYGNYGQSPTTKRRLADEAAKKAAADAAAKKGKGKGTKKDPKDKTPPKTLTPDEKKKAEESAKKTSLTKDGWEWGEDVKEDAIETLTPIRDGLHKELEDLGPTPEQRLEEIKLDGAQATSLRDAIQRLSWNRSRRDRGGNVRANVRRNNRMKEVVNGYGIKALPSLIKGLSNNSYWVKRMSAQAIAELMKSPQGDAKVTGLAKMDTKKARWLGFHFRAPESLLKLLDEQEQPISAFVRSDANKALEATTGQKSRFKEGKDALRSSAESAALKQWKIWWPRALEEWKAAEEKALAKRAELFEKLQKVQQGTNPTEKEDEKG